MLALLSFQEEMRFCINPELLLAIMFAEAMQDNECIVVRVCRSFNYYIFFYKFKAAFALHVLLEVHIPYQKKVSLLSVVKDISVCHGFLKQIHLCSVSLK